MADFVSILMPYYDRATVLHNTLFSYRRFLRFDYEVVIVDDGSPDRIGLLGTLHRQAGMKITLLSVDRPKEHRNPAILFNLAVERSVGDVLCLTNPEVMHTNSVEMDVQEGQYVLCACLDMRCGPVARFDERRFPRQVATMQSRSKLRWLQHGTRNNRGLHWCSFVRRSDFLTLGMFDESFSTGVGYEDDELSGRMRHHMQVVHRDDIVTIHQYHGQHQNALGPLGETNRNRYQERLRQGFPVPSPDLNVRDQTRVLSVQRLGAGQSLAIGLESRG